MRGAMPEAISSGLSPIEVPKVLTATVWGLLHPGLQTMQLHVISHYFSRSKQKAAMLLHVDAVHP